MFEASNNPWPFFTTVLVTALVLRRSLKVWGYGFGVEVNASPEGSRRPKPRTNPKRKRQKK